MHIDQRLLECVSYGTQGGPTFMTRRMGLRNGHVRRNPVRSRPLYEFVLLYKNLEEEDHAAVRDAFNACMAGVHSFRLKDWSDYEATNELLGPVGTGAPQVIQLTKRYSFGPVTLFRPIRQPVNGTVELTSGGSPIGHSVDYLTGLVTVTAASGDVLRWSGEFDVPVMFVDDKLPFSFDNRNAQGFFLTGDVTLEEDFSV